MPPPVGTPPNQATGERGEGFQPFTPPPVGGYYQPLRSPPAPPGEAIAALVCGMLAWSCFPLGFLAIWLGARARTLARENPETVGGDGMALAGMIVGGILATMQLVFWIIYLWFFATVIGLGAASGP